MDNAKSIVAEIDGDVVVIDPLAEDWLTEKKRIITIRKYLNCRK